MSGEPHPATSPATGRPRCTVGLDLRRPSRAGAVAVDRKGRVRAWASIEGEDDRIALAKRALETLAVRPRELRVLLGSESARVAGYEGAEAPEASQIGDTLAAEGYEPILEPAVAAVPAGPGTWLVAGCEEEEVRSLAEGLAELMAAEPKLVVDRLLLLQGLEGGSAALESAEEGLLVVTRPRDSTPLVRSLPAALDARRLQAEVLRTLEAGGASRVWILGSQRGELRRALEPSGLDLRHGDLPACGRHPLPPAHELAWHLAAAEEVPAIEGPRLEARSRSLLWARRVAVMAIALTLLSALMVVVSIAAAVRIQARKSAERAELSGIQEQVQRLRETAELAQRVQQLRAELGPRSLPWPPIAAPIAALTRESPQNVGWEHLAIADGELELEVSAAGPTALEDLGRLRRALEKVAGIGNVSWEEPMPDEQGFGVRQLFRATILTLPPRGEKETP